MTVALLKKRFTAVCLKLIIFKINYVEEKIGLFFIYYIPSKDKTCFVGIQS